MENNFKDGFDRRSEDRRDYGSRKSNNEEGRTMRPRRPRIGRTQPAGERLYSSNDERRFVPAGEQHSYQGSGERRSFRNNGGYSDNGYSGARRDNGQRGGYRSGSYGNSRRESGYGDYRGYGSDYDGRRRNSGQQDRRNSGYGESRERRFYQTDGESRPYDGERRPYSGDRRPSFQTKPYGSRNSGNGRGPAGRRPAKPKNFSKPRVASNQMNGINKMIERKRLQDAEAFSDFDAAPVQIKEEIRLNKFIANSGICSRREADNFIQAGVVTVNGEVVTELGTKINIFTDDVRFNGERLKGEQKVYIVMNKPKGYVTTTSDPHAEKTVMDLLKGCKSRVFSVGRLDKNTTGVLMFTNDGEMAEKLTHPSYNKKKIYQVTLSTPLEQEDYDKILGGVTLSDGEIAADELEYIDDADHRKIGIEIHSGKNRIVRRIFESLGYEVKGLDRVYFAGLTKKGLKKGQWRYLSDSEINILKIGSYQ